VESATRKLSTLSELLPYIGKLTTVFRRSPIAMPSAERCRRNNPYGTRAFEGTLKPLRIKHRWIVTLTVLAACPSAVSRMLTFALPSRTAAAGRCSPDPLRRNPAPPQRYNIGTLRPPVTVTLLALRMPDAYLVHRLQRLLRSCKSPAEPRPLPAPRHLTRRSPAKRCRSR